MKNLRKQIAVFITFIMAAGMFSMNVMAEEELAITQFRAEGRDGVITESEDGNTILVEGFPCSTDITGLVVEVWYPADAEVELVDDERLDGRRQDMDPLVPEFVNFTNARIFRLIRGEETKDYLVTVKADEHRMTKASCTEKAKCEVCGYEEGEALGHDFGEWEVTKKSTIAEKGEETRSCVRCAYKEVRETERLNQTAEASKNKIEKIEAGRRYLVNEKIVFRAVGDGMGNGNPISGDTRFLPVKWRIGLQNTWKEFSGEAEFKIEKAGNYRINVLYQEQIFKDGKWASTENTDIKEVKFRIGAADEKKEEVKRAVKTGDKETGALYIGAAVIAVAVLAAIAKMKRKTR